MLGARAQRAIVLMKGNINIFSKEDEDDRIRTSHHVVMSPLCYPLRHETKENLGQIFLRLNNFEKKCQDGGHFLNFSKKIFLHFLQL